jgi:ornithine cyclodeaminase/alanine dehydrogenase-like protein (mu-crystallin family)
VSAELSEVLTGAKPGRTRADEITIFKSVGWALEDLAAARLAYNRARSAGLGTEVFL